MRVQGEDYVVPGFSLSLRCWCFASRLMVSWAVNSKRSLRLSLSQWTSRSPSCVISKLAAWVGEWETFPQGHKDKMRKRTWVLRQYVLVKGNKPIKTRLGLGSEYRAELHVYRAVRGRRHEAALGIRGLLLITGQSSCPGAPWCSGDGSWGPIQGS